MCASVTVCSIVAPKRVIRFDSRFLIESLLFKTVLYSYDGGNSRVRLQYIQFFGRILVNVQAKKSIQKITQFIRKFYKAIAGVNNGDSNIGMLWWIVIYFFCLYISVYLCMCTQFSFFIVIAQGRVLVYVIHFLQSCGSHDESLCYQYTLSNIFFLNNNNIYYMDYPCGCGIKSTTLKILDT